MPSDVTRLSELRLLIISPIAATATTALIGVVPGESSSVFRTFLKGLTGVEPIENISSFAGYTSHPPLHIKNRYYDANVSIWCDELPDSLNQVEEKEPASIEWVKNMQSDEAREVREVIGGIILLLPYSSTLMPSTPTNLVDSYCKLLAQVNILREMVEDETGRDIATVAVVQETSPMALRKGRNVEKSNDPTAFHQKFEDACLSDHGIFGWDIVYWDVAKSEEQGQNEIRNELGEKEGMARILEVLEQTDWSASTSMFGDGEDYELAGVDDFSDLEDEFDEPGLKPKIQLHHNRDPIREQSNEFQQEIAGLHFALEDQIHQEAEINPESGDDLQVDQMMSLMSRASEIKAEGASMSKEEREKFARKEVTKLMRELQVK